MIKKIIITAIAAGYTLLSVNAEQLPPLANFERPSVPTPTAYSFQKFGDVPVDYYSGVPDISIPVYTIKDGEFEMPITLRYHGGGIRVDEEAGWVGLGWNLNVGGTIIRNIMGEDDDRLVETSIIPSINNLLQYSGQITCNSHCNEHVNLYPNLLHSTMYNLMNIGCDQGYRIFLNAHTGRYRPDIYYFNCMGFSGKFFIDYDDNLKLLSGNTNLKIQYEGYGNTRYFSIIDINGVIYYFSCGEVKYAQAIGQADRTTITSYTCYLTKIVYPSGMTILFKYTAPPASYSQSIVRLMEQGKFPPNCIIITDCQELNQIQWESYMPIFLDSIITPNLTVKFSTSSRSDITGERKLDYIKVTDKYNNSKKFDFTYGYFTGAANGDDYCSSNSANAYMRTNYQYLTAVLDKNDKTKRLKLLSYREQGQNSYTFDYYEVGLPVKTSFAQDHWGYFNGAYSNTTLIPNFNNLPDFVEKSSYFCDEPVSNADRGADSIKAKVFSLTTIHFPTGGAQTFEYELNSFGNWNVPMKGETYDECEEGQTCEYNSRGGGLRIKSILTKASPTDADIKKTYTYHGGILMVPPIYYGNVAFFWQVSDGEERHFAEDLYYRSTPFYRNDLLTNSCNVGYTTVFEVRGDWDNHAGYTEYNYNNREPSYLKVYAPDYHCITYEYGNTPHYIPTYTLDLPVISQPENGKLNTVIVNNKNESEIKKTEYDYTFDTDNYYYSMYLFSLGLDQTCKIPPTPLECYNPCEINYGPGIVAYPLYSYRLSKLYKYEEFYDNYYGAYPPYNWSYSEYNEHSQVAYEEKDLLNNPEWTAAYYTYPSTFEDDICSESSGSDLTACTNSTVKKMIDKHILSPVLEKEVVFNGKVTSAQCTEYDNTALRPSKIYALETETPLDNINGLTLDLQGGYVKDPKYTLYGSFDLYDTYNNPLQSHKANDIYTSYIWGYNNTLLIAKADNAQASQVAFSDFEPTSGKGNWAYAGASNMSVSKTGRYSYKLSAGYITKTLLPGTYRLDYWAKDNVAVSGGTITNIRQSAADANGWVLYEKEITCTSNTTITISGLSYIDALRLYPSGAQMTTYTYEPLKGVTAIADPENLVTTYEYDQYCRLQRIRDHKGNIVKEYEIKLKGVE